MEVKNYRDEDLVKKLKKEIVELNLKLRNLRPKSNLQYSLNKEYFDLAGKRRRLRFQLEKEIFKPKSPENKRKSFESVYNASFNREEVIEIKDRAKKLFNSKISIKDDNYIQEIDAIYNFFRIELQPSGLNSLPESNKLNTKLKKRLVEKLVDFEGFSFPEPSFLRKSRWKRLLGVLVFLVLLYGIAFYILIRYLL
ncbi:MAG: hypothetical protein HWN79_17690 [Candidatus Lokiarchaeota archaeon]|nr:hypothetical protein [Candidatus Lokiarchaeota archaeon]